MRETPHAKEIRKASDASGQTIERLDVKTPSSAPDVLRPVDDRDGRGRIRMTADEMLALGDAVVALPLLDRRTPDAVIDDLGSP